MKDCLYDGVNELVQDENEADTRGNQTFSYDLAGNRTEQTISATTETYSTPNNLNRLANAGPYAFTYDAEGNRTQETYGLSTTASSWDGKDRLSSVTLPDGSVVSYTYDWQNRLAVRTHGSETKTFLYGEGTQVLEETYNGKRSALYGWGPDGLDSRIDANGQTLFYLKDGLGSTLAVVDDRGRMVMPYEYSAYGECLTGPDAVNPYRFEGGIGGRTDNDTGLVYFWNRWYDPAVGRWVSEDPIRQWGGLNLYEAMGNNLPKLMDSFGLLVLYFGNSETAGIGTATSAGGGGYFDTSTLNYGTYQTSGSTSGNNNIYLGASGSISAVGGYSSSAAAFGGTSQVTGGGAGEDVGGGYESASNAAGNGESLSLGFTSGTPADAYSMTTQTTLTPRGNLGNDIENALAALEALLGIKPNSCP